MPWAGRRSYQAPSQPNERARRQQRGDRDRPIHDGRANRSPPPNRRVSEMGQTRPDRLAADVTAPDDPKGPRRLRPPPTTDRPARQRRRSPAACNPWRPGEPALVTIWATPGSRRSRGLAAGPGRQAAGPGRPGSVPSGWPSRGAAENAGTTTATIGQPAPADLTPGVGDEHDYGPAAARTTLPGQLRVAKRPSPHLRGSGLGPSTRWSSSARRSR